MSDNEMSESFFLFCKVKCVFILLKRIALWFLGFYFKASGNEKYLESGKLTLNLSKDYIQVSGLCVVCLTCRCSREKKVEKKSEAEGLKDFKSFVLIDRKLVLICKSIRSLWLIGWFFEFLPWFWAWNYQEWFHQGRKWDEGENCKLHSIV